MRIMTGVISAAVLAALAASPALATDGHGHRHRGVHGKHHRRPVHHPHPVGTDGHGKAPLVPVMTGAGPSDGHGK